MRIQEIAGQLGLNLTEKSDLEMLMQKSNAYTLNKTGDLIGLNLSSNNLTDRQVAFVWELTSLQALNLSENRLAALSVPATMKELRLLNLSENASLSSLAFEAGLPNLEKADLSECGLKEIVLPAGFLALHTLDAQRNQLSSFIAEGDCPALKLLDLSENQLSQLILPVGLPRLELFHLQGGNKVSDISFLRGAGALQTLNLSQNAVTDLGPIRGLLGKNIPFQWEKSGNGILLEDCPLATPPPEIIKQGNEAIAAWFAAKKRELNEIKVLLVGEAKAGKTSLLRRLKYDEFEPEEVQTDGIIIEEFDFEELHTFKQQKGLHDTKAYFWDFGGQEIMSSTHQFFMTKRSVYLLVLEARRDQDADKQVRQWLQRIQAFGGRSQVIVVVNKIDLNPAFGLDTVRLGKDYLQIKDFISLSCKTGEKIDALKEALAAYIPKAELFSTQIDERWIEIKEDLQKFTKEEYYIPHRQFRQICRAHHLFEEAEQNQAIHFLNDLGIVLHFDELDLGEYFVLDPYWVTSGVYRIVTSDTAARQKGEVELEQLNYIVNEEKRKAGEYIPEAQKKIVYSPYELRYLADIMAQFKLSFYLEGRKKILIPDLLDKKTPDEQSRRFTEAPEKLQLVYQYNYLPPSVMPRLMVEMRRDITVPWRTGVILNCQASIAAEAMVSSSEHSIKIIVTGDYKQKRGYLSTIRYFLDKINEDFDVQIKILIPLPGHDGHFARYENLLKMEKAGEGIYKDWDIEEEFEISKLLDGIVSKDEVQKVMETDAFGAYEPTPVFRKIKIFLASSSELKADREQFEIFISRENKNWIDEGVFLELILWEDFIDAMSRSRLQDEYNKAIRECDIFISLFATKVGKYTLEEFETAFGQFKKSDQPLVYTYFKDAPMTTESYNIEDLKSLEAFKDKLKNLGHFRTIYKNTESLLLQARTQFEKIIHHI